MENAIIFTTELWVNVVMWTLLDFKIQRFEWVYKSNVLKQRKFYMTWIIPEVKSYIMFENIKT